MSCHRFYLLTAAPAAPLHAIGDFDAEETEQERELAERDLGQSQPGGAPPGVAFTQDVALVIEVAVELGQVVGEVAEDVRRPPLIGLTHGIPEARERQHEVALTGRLRGDQRSEERRVGKEGRGGWAAGAE